MRARSTSSPPPRRARDGGPRWPVCVAALAALLLSVPALLGTAPATPRQSGRDAAASPPPAAAPPLVASPSPVPGLSPEEGQRITARIEDYLAGQEGRLAISVHDLATGTTYGYGGDQTFPTGSLVKLNILVLLLLQADDEERELTAEERDLAEQMIRYSDNDVTDLLYQRIGFDAGFARGNARLGLRATVAGGGQPGVWGATTTTTADQIRLLRAVFTDSGPLSRHSRSYARRLLGSVAPEQAWGVSAAAGEGDRVELKNGWVPRDVDGGRWAISSAGHVHGERRSYLIAVLSDRHLGYGEGVACVEHVVTEVVDALEENAARQRGTDHAGLAPRAS
ncbi:serine hydrolase [Marinactinospora thermotolerans]|uniref:Beta-lactamase class A n=1 Tax=Marinactinospora thermotolerans DSM 45154 TaxID=1122192 RepID=A0A1T4RS49_9ACTN|nr:serine hydrolase [Marinactinospora thermotolerans]SKA18481.1 Beta-lactamase class A [Marinactinospora thermotolerans DSM 45154]